MPEDHFEEGIRLFNAGAYWEAHETWEEPWRAARGEEARFYQGLIQTAAACHHAQRNNRHGAAQLSRLALEKLEGLGPVFHTVDLAGLRSLLQELAARAAEGETVLLPSSVTLARSSAPPTRS